MLRWLPIALFLTPCLFGCQQPTGGARQPLFDMSRGPNLFNLGRNAPSTDNPWGSDSQVAGNGFRWKNPFSSNPDNSTQNPMLQGLSEQIQGLTQRLGQFDSDNQQLLTELAGMKQKLQAANDYNYQLKQQLTDSIAQLQQIQNEKLGLEQQLAGTQMRGNLPATAVPAGTSGGIPSQLPGGATLRANNSLLQKVSLIQLPGITTRMDGDVIRIELPSDQLFVPNSYQINTSYGQVLQQLAQSVRAHFPDQIVGIEAHWDNTPIQPATTTHHQLTASQSLAVFDYLSRLGLPERQLFTMSMGSNRPRHPAAAPAQGVSPNRRVEIVIYPESWNGT